MSLFKRGVLFLVSVALLIGLVGLAFALSTNLVLGKPENAKASLKQSGFYNSFADTLVDQANDASGDVIGGDRISFTNPTIRQAAHDALSAPFLEKQGNEFIDSNYAWLEGKEDKPNFRIDLTSAREDFAKRVGDAAVARLETLPTCTPVQLGQLQGATNADLFSLPCKPPTFNLTTEGERLTKEITDSTAFLSNPVITPDSLNPSESEQSSQPYYKSLSFAPTLYKVQKVSPYVFGVLVVLCVILMYALASPKRKATRRLAATFLVAGILLLIDKFGADYLFEQLQKQAVNADNSGKLQESLISLSRHIESQLVQINMLFGLAFVGLAIVLYLLLRVTRDKTAKAKRGAYKQAVRDFTAEPAGPSVLTEVPTPRAQAPRQSAPTPTSPPQLRQRNKRPPRLIQ
jgi:hypothetical protein